MTPRPLHRSLALIVSTILLGLAIRLLHLGLPAPVVKYAGSALWAMMIYWIISALLPHASLRRAIAIAFAVSATVELFKLVHTPSLDRFRLTLPGILLLGRVFSMLDIAVYLTAILLAARIDDALRANKSPTP